MVDPYTEVSDTNHYTCPTMTVSLLRHNKDGCSQGVASTARVLCWYWNTYESRVAAASKEVCLRATAEDRQ